LKWTNLNVKSQLWKMEKFDFKKAFTQTWIFRRHLLLRNQSDLNSKRHHAYKKFITKEKFLFIYLHNRQKKFFFIHVHNGQNSKGLHACITCISCVWKGQYHESEKISCIHGVTITNNMGWIYWNCATF
jgi:hypothetical protein